MTDFYANSVLRVRETDHGDGTGTRTTFDVDGNITSTEQLTGLPIPQPPELTDAEKIAELQATVDALLDALTGGAP